MVYGGINSKIMCSSISGGGVGGRRIPLIDNDNLF